MKTIPMSSLPKYKRLAGVFPSSGVTLLVGSVGTGKTYCTMKSLKQTNIVPYWFNLDQTNLHPDFCDNDFKMVIDRDIIKDFITASSPEIPKDMQVLVIDTYTQLSMLVKSTADIANGLQRIAEKGVAVIVLAHPENYQNKSQLVFKENNYLLGNCQEYCELIHKPEIPATTKRPSEPESFNLRLVKARMFKETNPIKNWMRG